MISNPADNFDEEKHIIKMKPFVDKLLNHLKNKGIVVDSMMDGEHRNIVLHQKDKIVKISHHSFYGFSRIACQYKENQDKSFEIIPITDEMFVNIYLRAIIEALFTVKK